MAPEQVAGAEVGPAADVFAWAGVMVFAATGTPPFGRGSLPEVIRRVQYGEPLLDQVPDALRPIVAGCLDKDPARRPTMQDVLFQLIGAQPPARAARRPGAAAGPRSWRGRAALAVTCVAGATWGAAALLGGSGTHASAPTTTASTGSAALPRDGEVPRGHGEAHDASAWQEQNQREAPLHSHRVAHLRGHRASYLAAHVVPRVLPHVAAHPAPHGQAVPPSRPRAPGA
ncbi:protein kinase [Nonomuraea dietziae]|uniref:protein kinase n=1 Tax=Nonomuraea dietziae TaxID=65515 RepID=UPI0031D5DC43